MKIHRRAAIAQLLVTCALAAVACSTHTAKPNLHRDATQPTTTTLRLAPGQVDHVVDTSFQYGSFTITVGHAVYDRRAQQLTVGLRFHNTSEVWGQSEISGMLTKADGTQVGFSGQPYVVPPGSTIDVTGSSATVPTDPFPHGKIAWGSPDRSQPVIRLDGHGGTNLWLPRSIKLDGWAHIGKFGVHATRAVVNAAELNMGIQAPAGMRILRVYCDAFTNKGTVSPFAAKDNLLLKLPDGSTVDALDGSPAGGQLSWVQQPGTWADFPIPTSLRGRYSLLLASMPKLGFGTIRPELIERRPIAFVIGALTPRPPPHASPPVPDLTPPGTVTKGIPIDQKLAVGTMNVSGYDVTPTRLRWDPSTTTVTLDVTVTALAGHGPGGTIGLAAVSGLGAPPQFGFSEVIISHGKPLTGVVSGPAQVDPDKPTHLTLSFLGAQTFDADDAALYVGSSGGGASSLPLGATSPVAAYPDHVSTTTITAPAVSAGPWTVTLRAARLGLLVSSTPPRPGWRDLEVTFDVQAAPDAAKNAFGLSFSAKYQLLLAGPSGYDTEAIAGDDPVQQKPGQVLRYTTTFEVPETFHGGQLAFVLRSRSEVGDLTTSWIETRFIAAVGTTTTAADLGGPS